MNPLDATIVRLGVYIGQLEAQNTELHRQLREAIVKADKAPPADEPFDTEVEFNKQASEGYSANDPH